MPIDHSKNIIEVKNVSFGYSNTPAIEGITLTIHQGDYVGIIGPNGGGKTTLLKVMLGLLKPSSGGVKLLGSACIGYVPQKAINFDLLFPATAYEVAAMGRYGKRGLCKWLTAEDHRIIAQALERVDMLEHKNRLIGELSSGQQQRVFIARALAGEPEVIFLDEPTVGVDARAQEKFYALLRMLNQELGLTLVVASHDIHVIAAEATELACVNQTLAYHGEPKELMAGDYLQKLYGNNIRAISHDHHIV